MANPTPEIMEIIARLESGKISPKTAVRKSTALKLRRSWEQAWWKEERAKIIGETCSVCGTTIGPMVLQHHYHPPSLKTVMKMRRSWYAWLAENPYPEIDLSTIPTRNACPECGSIQIYPTRNGKLTCRNKLCFGPILTEPLPQVPDPEAIEDHRKRHQEKYRKWAKEAQAVQSEDVIVWLQGHLRYISFEDVTTYCQKCAFKEDIVSVRRTKKPVR